VELKKKNRKIEIHQTQRNPHFILKKNRLFKALRKALFPSRVFLLPFLHRQAKSGRSFHYGGTLPMGVITDSMGQLKNYKGLFIVDASTFPNIPSRTILLTIMANSMRIASEATLNE
jgi:choline dehydrogenase-like flavoprotein